MPFRKLLPSRPKFRAHLPCKWMPEELYYHGFKGSAHDPKCVTVTTDAHTKAKVTPLPATVMPTTIAPQARKTYADALAMAEKGIPLVYILKDCGIHQQTLYSCPVYDESQSVIGVLMAIDSPPVGCCPLGQNESCSHSDGVFETLLEYHQTELVSLV